ncbi:MAG: transposase, partial [Planctomycetota bacterium]
MDRVPVSDLCDKHNISTVLFYGWQKILFEQGEIAFKRKKNAENAARQESAQAVKTEQLEQKLRQKNEVVSELLEEH